MAVLTVPERRTPEADPSKTLALPVVVIASLLTTPTTRSSSRRRADRAAAPLNSLWYFLDYADWALDDRDVILVEQRGDALAEPSLNCPELDLEHFVVDGVAPLRRGGCARDGASRSRPCRDRLTAEGIDLAAYTSAESAADLADSAHRARIRRVESVRAVVRRAPGADRRCATARKGCGR